MRVERENLMKTKPLQEEEKIEAEARENVGDVQQSDQKPAGKK